MKKFRLLFILLLLGMSVLMAFGQTVATKTFTVNGVSFKMVKVEGGTFTMGSTPDQGEMMVKQPTRQVSVNTFLIGETEVTQELWQAVMGSNPSVFSHAWFMKHRSGVSNIPPTQKFPVENISWQDCKKFIEKLNKLTNQQFRLPTEEEWEYAARGGKNAKPTMYAGSNNIDDVGWYAQNSGKKYLDKNYKRPDLVPNECQTHPVATKKPNELGLYDMTGNVCEYTSTKYQRSAYKEERNKLIVKGGAYSYSRETCVLSGIGVVEPNFCNSEHGFRLVTSNIPTSMDVVSLKPQNTQIEYLYADPTDAQIDAWRKKYCSACSGAIDKNGYDIPKKMIAEHPCLVYLVLQSKSEKKDKQDWFDMFSLMNSEQINKLYKILYKEQYRLKK